MLKTATIVKEMEANGIRVTGDEDKAVFAYMFLTRPEFRAEVTEIVWNNRER